MGSHFDEPIFWADLLVKGGHNDVGVLMEQSLVGEAYVANFRKACRQGGIGSLPRPRSLRPHRTSARRYAPVRREGASDRARGFGFGVVFVNPALAELDWDPPRFAGTAFQNAWINPVMWNAFMGWMGVDQYDEGNPVGQRSSTSSTRLPAAARMVCPGGEPRCRVALLHAFGDAHPLSPRGVKEALERVKLVPAASARPDPDLVR